MDGYFYVLTGDKGLHGGRGTDGSRPDISTGSIFTIQANQSRPSADRLAFG